MIALFLASLFVAIAIALFARKLSVRLRVVFSALAFVLINSPTVLVLLSGDKPQPGAKTVTLEELRVSAGREGD